MTSRNVTPDQGLVPDGNLLEDSAAGNQDAFRELYISAAASVSRLVNRVLHDSAQAEEVVQEAFLEAWLHADRYRADQGAVMPWLHTIARRRAIDRVRASQASRERDLRIGIRDHSIPSDEVSDTIDATANAEHLRSLLAHLQSRDQHLITRVHLRGYSYEDAAHVLGLPVGTVKSRLSEAMKTLRKIAQAL